MFTAEIENTDDLVLDTVHENVYQKPFICINMKKMKTKKYDANTGTFYFETGVTMKEAKEFARKHGYYLPLYPINKDGAIQKAIKEDNYVTLIKSK